MHFAVTLALCNLFSQIREPHIGTIALNQFLFSVLARPSAFLTGQANYVAGIIAELKRATHVRLSLAHNDVPGIWSELFFT